MRQREAPKTATFTGRHRRPLKSCLTNAEKKYSQIHLITKTDEAGNLCQKNKQKKKKVNS